MTLPITPEVLAAAYDYLASTEPFRKWNLPDSDDIKFRVVRSRKMFAQYIWDGTHTIEVSSATVGHTKTLMETMSHELVHLHLRLTGMESRSDNPNVHNAAFRKLAAKVCATHGFDVKAFY
jgi:hypothetical protein